MGIFLSMCTKQDNIKENSRKKINKEYIKFLYGPINFKGCDVVDQIYNNKYSNFIPVYVLEFTGYNCVKSRFGDIRSWSKHGIGYVNCENLNSPINFSTKEEITKKGFTNAQYDNALEICVTLNNLTKRKFTPSIVKCSTLYNKIFIMNLYLQYNTITSKDGLNYNSTNFTKLKLGTTIGHNNIKSSSLTSLIKPFLKNRNYKHIVLDYKEQNYNKYLTIQDLLDVDGNFYRHKNIFPSLETSIVEKLVNNTLYVTIPTSFYVRHVHYENLIVVPEQKYPKLYITSLENQQKKYLIN
jgi:hypothetical protein